MTDFREKLYDRMAELSKLVDDEAFDEGDKRSLFAWNAAALAACIDLRGLWVHLGDLPPDWIDRVEGEVLVLDDGVRVSLEDVLRDGCLSAPSEAPGDAPMATTVRALRFALDVEWVLEKRSLPAVAPWLQAREALVGPPWKRRPGRTKLDPPFVARASEPRAARFTNEELEEILAQRCAGTGYC